MGIEASEETPMLDRPPHNAQATLAALAAEPQLQLLLQSLQQQSGANTVEAVQLQGLEQLFAQIQLQQPLVSPACAGALSPQPLQAWLGAMSQQLQQLTEQLQALERTARSHLLETATAVPQRAVPVLPAVAAAQFPSPPVVNNKEARWDHFWPASFHRNFHPWWVMVGDGSRSQAVECQRLRAGRARKGGIEAGLQARSIAGTRSVPISMMLRFGKVCNRKSSHVAIFGSCCSTTLRL
eukprot:s1080_g2.t1